MISFALLIGASVTAMTFGTVSPGHLLAEKMGLPVELSAHAGRPLSEVMPPDSAIKEAKVVVAIDALYWSSNLWPCDGERKALEHLLSARGEKPMVLGTIPEGEGWAKGRCTDLLNAMVRSRCKDACMVVEFNGELLPPALHPDEEFSRKVFQKIVKEQQWTHF